MLAVGRKFALDTNVFIDAFRDAARNEELQRFRAASAPFEHLSAVVAMELRSGAQSDIAAARLERNILAPFERRGRVLAPTYAAWKRAGTALAALARLDGVTLRTLGRTFALDAVLAASCGEVGVVLVTSNLQDFTRLRRVLVFEFAPAWT